MAEAGFELFPNGERHLRPRRRLAEIYPPPLLEQSLAVAEQCRFSLSKYKEGTSRIALYRELNIPNIFTMEASFCGADRGELKNQHFTIEALMNMGKKLLEAVIINWNIPVKQGDSRLNR